MDEAKVTEEAPVKEIPREKRISAWKEMKAGFKEFFPQEFWKHRQSARKEMLLAWRSLLDAAIERLEEEPEKKKEAKKITVQ